MRAARSIQARSAARRRNGRAIDEPRRLMYVADFSTSVLRVADLRPLVACLEGGSTGPEECAPQLLGLVGLPQPVSELPR